MGHCNLKKCINFLINLDALKYQSVVQQLNEEELCTK